MMSESLNSLLKSEFLLFKPKADDLSLYSRTIITYSTSLCLWTGDTNCCSTKHYACYFVLSTL